MEIVLKILEKGDQVLNIWSNELGTYIAVKRESGEVYVYSIRLDDNKLSRIDKESSFLITYGNDEIKATNDKGLTVGTF